MILMVLGSHVRDFGLVTATHATTGAHTHAGSCAGARTHTYTRLAGKQSDITLLTCLLATRTCSSTYLSLIDPVNNPVWLPTLLLLPSLLDPVKDPAWLPTPLLLGSVTDQLDFQLHSCFSVSKILQSQLNLLNHDRSIH